MRAVPRARAIAELARADEAARARARSLLASCLLVTRSDRYEIDTFYGDSCFALCCVPCSHYQVWEYLNKATVSEPGPKTPLIEPPAPAPEPVAESSPMER